LVAEEAHLLSHGRTPPSSFGLVSGLGFARALRLLVIAIDRLLLGDWCRRLRFGDRYGAPRRILVEIGDRARHFGSRCRPEVVSDRSGKPILQPAAPPASAATSASTGASLAA
jgi:hypothetical protein